MQVTRQRIIDLLRQKGQATVEELAEVVELTQMAVRHHLNVLQAEDLIAVSHTKRQHKPGRPVQIYSLTEKARKLYPQEYFQLTDLLVDEIASRIGRPGVVDVFDSIANRLVEDAPDISQELPTEEKLEQVVSFLKEKGFVVEWEKRNGQFIIHHLDCPYRQFARRHQEICRLDQRVISNMLNMTPTRISCIAHNDEKCTYMLSPGKVNNNQPVELVVPR